MRLLSEVGDVCARYQDPAGKDGAREHAPAGVTDFCYMRAASSITVGCVAGETGKGGADNMNDTEIAATWNEHSPKWRENRLSSQVCRLICDLLRTRARHVTVGHTDVEKIHHVLETCHIPCDQFLEVSPRASV